MSKKKQGLSFIVPVYNEANAIVDTLSRLKKALDGVGMEHEIIAVNDGSTDDSASVAATCEGVRVIGHPVNSGYGKALKTGIAAAQYDWIGIVDADGTYPIEELPRLVEKMNDGFDMVVARRMNALELDSPVKRMFRRIFIFTVKFLVGKEVLDPNSGFRLFKKNLVMRFLPFLCDAFSFTTSLSVFAFGDGHFVTYVPTEYAVREGKSKVRHIRDSFRTAQLVIQGISFSNPIKFYLLMILFTVFVVAFPAWLMSSIGWATLATYYFVVGLTVVGLLAIGVLCDTLRIAILNRDIQQYEDRP